jgi:hypothetical protein
VTAATPGQAVYEVWRAAVPEIVCNVPAGKWEDLPGTVRGGFDAIAAQQPQPAPGDVREQLDAMKTVLQETSRESSQRGARADEFARVKVRLCALVASLDDTVERCRNTDSEFDMGAAHASAVTARQLREILTDTALGVTPQPAPVTVRSLAAAFAGRQILVDVDQAEHSDAGDGMWLVTPARPHDLAVQLLTAIDSRLTGDPQPPSELAALATQWEADALLADKSTVQRDGSISGRAYRRCAAGLREAAGIGVPDGRD